MPSEARLCGPHETPALLRQPRPVARRRPAATVIGMTKLLANLVAMYLLAFAPLLVALSGSAIGAVKHRLRAETE